LCAGRPRRAWLQLPGRLDGRVPYVCEGDKAMASKSQDVRPKITLACTECKERNYITKKNRRNNPDRMEMAKFCPRCRKHTAHRETR